MINFFFYLQIDIKCVCVCVVPVMKPIKFQSEEYCSGMSVGLVRVRQEMGQKVV